MTSWAQQIFFVSFWYLCIIFYDACNSLSIEISMPYIWFRKLKLDSRRTLFLWECLRFLKKPIIHLFKENYIYFALPFKHHLRCYSTTPISSYRCHYLFTRFSKTWLALLWHLFRHCTHTPLFFNKGFEFFRRSHIVAISMLLVCLNWISDTCSNSTTLSLKHFIKQLRFVLSFPFTMRFRLPYSGGLLRGFKSTVRVMT